MAWEAEACQRYEFITDTPVSLVGFLGHPTIGEAGYPGVTSTSWNGIVAPTGTPKAVISLLNAKINEVVSDPAFKAKALGIGLVAAGGTPEEFTAHIDRERVRWAKVVKAADIKVQ